MNQEQLQDANAANGGDGDAENLDAQYMPGAPEKARKPQPKIAIFVPVRDAVLIDELRIRRMKKEGRDVRREALLSEALRLLAAEELPSRKRPKGH